MLDELIMRTNSKEFYSDWNLKLESVFGKIESYEENKFEINLSIENEFEPENLERENWQITAEGIIEIRGIFSSSYLPYIKLSLIEDHPLLWKFKYDELECELSGVIDKPHDFVSKLHWLYEEKTGGFIDWKRDFYGIQNLINGKNKIPLFFNMKTYNFVKSIIDDFGLELEVIEKINKKDSEYTNAKVLMFGNPDVSPNNFNLSQPFIIANKFTATKIKEENEV